MEQMKGMKGDGFSDGATSLANALWPPTQGGAPRGGPARFEHALPSGFDPLRRHQ